MVQMAMVVMVLPMVQMGVMVMVVVMGGGNGWWEECGFTLRDAPLIFWLVNYASLAPVEVHTGFPGEEHEAGRK
ncbi:hypothetical protein Q9966_002885 [Columba livia]|nr:hypothetical protein Q9966_002885 [Columba livia]